MVYEQLGVCYRLIRSHMVALKMFKKLLQLSWEQESPDYEIKAYRFLSFQYNYIGNLKKAASYNERAQAGQLEKPESKVRQLCVNMIRNKRNLKADIDFEESNSDIEDGFDSDDDFQRRNEKERKNSNLEVKKTIKQKLNRLPSPTGASRA